MRLLALFTFLLLLANPAYAQLVGATGNIPVYPLIAPGTPPVWQGMGQGMKLTVQGVNNAGTTMSRLVRTPHYSNVAFRYFKVVIPTSFSVGGTVIASTSAAQASGTTLTFTTTPLVCNGMTVTDTTTGGAIPGGTTVSSTTGTTVVLSATATGVGSGDSINFAFANGAVKDCLYQGAQATFSVQVGLEYTYAHANTGLAARIPVTFGGQNYFTYTYGSAQGNACSGGCEVSDIIDVCSTGLCTNNLMPANNQFGLEETFELPAAAANAIPYVNTISNYTQRYIGKIDSTTSQIAALGGSSDVALTATSIAAATTSEAGDGSGLTPAFMIIEVPAGTKTVAIDGDCLPYGNEEGTYPNWVTGTAYVSGAQVLSTVSGILKGVYTNQTASCTSGVTAPSGTGSPSDGACTWAYTPGASLAGDVMGDANSNIGANERWVGEVLGHNFVNFGRGSDKFIYRATSANWTYRQQMMALTNATDVYEEMIHNDLSDGETVANILSYAQTTYTLIKNELPSVRIVQMAATSGSTSSDNFVTTGNQTAIANFGNSATHRGVFNDTYIRTCGSALGSVGFADPNPSAEYGYTEGNTGSETSLWNVTGWQQGWTPDGTHWNSYGAQQIAANMYAANSSCVQVTDPF